MASFGKLTDGAGSTASSVDKMFVSQATPATSGTVTDGTARVWLSVAGSSASKLVIYADSSGAPGAKLAESDPVTITVTAEAPQNYTFSAGNQISITGATPYWIGVAWQDPGTPSFTVSRDSTASGRQEQVFTYPTLPNPFGTPSATNSGPVDVFINYTEAAAGGPATFTPAATVMVTR